MGNILSLGLTIEFRISIRNITASAKSVFEVKPVVVSTQPLQKKDN